MDPAGLPTDEAEVTDGSPEWLLLEWSAATATAAAAAAGIFRFRGRPFWPCCPPPTAGPLLPKNPPDDGGQPDDGLAPMYSNGRSPPPEEGYKGDSAGSRRLMICCWGVELLADAGLVDMRSPVEESTPDDGWKGL